MRINAKNIKSKGHSVNLLGKTIGYIVGDNYVSFRKPYHLYRKDNSYPVSVSVIEKYPIKKIFIITKDRVYWIAKGDLKSNAKIIRHKGFDEQYSLSIENWNFMSLDKFEKFIGRMKRQV